MPSSALRTRLRSYGYEAPPRLDLNKNLLGQNIHLFKLQSIQSGNVVADSTLSVSALRQKVMAGIEKHYGFNVPVQVLPASDWLDVATQNPFLPDRAEQIKSLHVTFLVDDPGPLNPLSINTVDEWQKRDRYLYLYCPNGYGRTKLTNTFWERETGMEATTRNWKTVLRLKGML